MGIKLILTLLITINTFYGSSLDADFSYDITTLQKSKLVVTAKVIPGKNKVYHIVINSILKKVTGITLKKGDKIKLLVPEWGSFGTKKRVYESEYIFYLTPYKSYWFSINGEQHIKPLENHLIPFEVCDRTFLLSNRRYKQMKHDMTMCFQRKGDYQYTIKMPLSEYNNTANPLAVVQELYKCHKNLIRPGIYVSEPFHPEPEPYRSDTSIYDFCEMEPGLLQTPEQYANIMQNFIPDSIRNNELGIQGNVYIKFVIEPDSTGNYFQVVRGIYPAYDMYALNLIKSLAPYKPGIIRGKAVRSYYILPVRIRAN